ncbi:tyrosine-protein phosphatase [soil metagenome]
MAQVDRQLNFPGLLNVRDLGGCVTCDGAQTSWRAFLRADELARLTPAGVQAVLDYGVRTVIDLRWPAETEMRPSIFQLDATLLHYVHISLLGVNEDGWRLLRPKATKEWWNCVALDHAQPQICAVLQTMAQAASGGVLFHCESGKDRTGIIAALLWAFAGVAPTVIAQDYALTTDNLYEAYLSANPGAQAATLERVRCPPERVYNMLTHLADVYGGIISYLRQIGLSERELRQLCGRLRA